MPNTFKRLIILLVMALSLPVKQVWAQNKSVGTWTNYLNFNDGRSVTDGEDYTYVAFESCIAAMRKSDNSIEYLSKTNGLNDVDINRIRYDFYHHVLVVTYNNSNIDIWKGFNKVTNVPDLYLRNSIGDNKIYDISIGPRYVYFSCGFGIVVYDVANSNIVDTYKPGNNGSDVKVTSAALYNDTLYAATATGLWCAPAADSSSLFNYSQWHIVAGHSVFNSSTVQSVVASKNSLRIFAGDTLFSYTHGTWRVLRAAKKIAILSCQNSAAYTTYVIDSAGSNPPYFIWAFDNNNNDAVWNLKPWDLGLTRDAVGVGTYNIWSADGWIGWRINQQWTNQVKTLPGPFNKETFTMQSYNGTLHVPGGLVNSAWNHGFRQNGFYEYNPSTNWINFNFLTKPALAGYQDFISVAVNPANDRIAYYGSFNKGLIEKKDTSITNHWDNTNSTLNNSLGDPSSLRISGLLFDNGGNLWVTCHNAANPLNVYTANHEWKQMLGAAAFGTNLVGGPMAQDNSGQIWFVGVYGGGVIAYNYGTDLSSTADDHAWRATADLNKGNLPNNLVYCLAVDKDGYIWVGTATGVAVFYCPEQANAGGCDAQKIIYKVPEDGHLGYLLETQEVLCMAVDGANRKWFGTRAAGVYLMSSDGTQQLQHFTQTNSPLLSNIVSSITVDNKTGEVFFATDKGIVSYISDATEGSDVMGNVYVTPNPVRETYSGNITVRGVSRDAIVKIADITGNLVWETKSQGGLALWDGNRLDGSRAASGVYLVYVISADGQTTATTKFVMLK